MCSHEERERDREMFYLTEVSVAKTILCWWYMVDVRALWNVFDGRES
jgi:hypothetical protein